MAKKKEEAATAQEYTVVQKLEHLYELQAIVSEIDRIRTIRGELPLEVQELEDELEGRNTRKQKLQKEIEGLKNHIADRKNKIEESNNLIERYQKQLEEVRNNREYDSLSKEIEYQNLEIEFSEKKINEAQAGIEHLTEQINALDEETAGRMQDLQLKRTELEEIVAETKQIEDPLHKAALELESRIEPRLLKAFKRTRKAARNGLAVVSIERDSCMGCFNKIPPQRRLDVQLRKKIIACEYCGRILVDPELAQEIDSRIAKK